jgi:hypothetical protein
MESPRDNLFLRLHKWAVRQVENVLTDAFAHVLQHLLDHEPEAAVALLENLTAGFFRLGPEEAKSVELRTQITLSEGTPDLEIRTSGRLAYVEVKSESEAGPEQLKKYRQILEKSGVPSTCLILLTRYPASISDEKALPDAFVRWYQVADWMEQECARYTLKSVSAYLVEQFLGFLGARNMTIGQVTWELPGGVRALRTFTDMLTEAATACGLKAQPWGSRNEMGVNLNNSSYWIGITYDSPQILTFWTYKGKKVDKDKAAHLGKGSVFEWDDKTGFGWKRELDLESEDVHFFARSKASQMQLLESFLKECLKMAQSVELPETKTSPKNEAADQQDLPHPPK